MSSQPTSHDTLEACSKRRKRTPASSLPNMAHVLGRVSPARAVLLSHVLDTEGLSSLIASFMPTRDLVMASCVNSAWLQTFSQPVCWQHTRLTASSTLVTADILQHLAKMPHLHALTLSSTNDLLQLQPTGWFNALSSRASSTAIQSAAPRSHSLVQMAVVGQINARLLPAFPDLQSLTGNLTVTDTAAYDDVRFPPGLQTLDLWSTLTEEMVDALLRHPPLGLQHCKLVEATPSQYRQLVPACPQLRTLHFIAMEADYIEVITILSACQQLTSLAITMSFDATECTAQVMDALISLPRLTTLKLFDAQVHIDGWQRLGDLRGTMASHLPTEQRNHQQRVHIELRAHSQFEPDDDSFDSWWLSTLLASRHCTVLELELEDYDDVGPSEATVQQYLAQSASPTVAQQPLSLLQMFDFDCFAALNKRQHALSFVQLHASLTTLDVEKLFGWTDAQTLALLSGPPALTRLSMNTHCPAVVQAALTAARSLQRLQIADFRVEYRDEKPNPVLLPQLLVLTQAATSLRWLSIAAAVVEWQAIAVSTIRMSTQLLDELRVTLVDEYDSDYGQQPPDELVHGLLTIPCLKLINISVAMDASLGDITTDSRRAAGLKPASIEVDETGACTDWDEHHFTD